MNPPEVPQELLPCPIAYMLEQYELDDYVEREYNAVDQFSCGRTGGEPLYTRDQMLAMYAKAQADAVRLLRELDSCIFNDSEGALQLNENKYCSLADEIGEILDASEGAVTAKRIRPQADAGGGEADVVPPASMSLYQGEDDIPWLLTGEDKICQFPAGSWGEVCDAFEYIVNGKLAHPTHSGPVEVMEELRVMLDSLEADASYLIGRVAVDGSCSGMIADNLRERVKAIRAALTVALAGKPEPFNPLDHEQTR